MTEAGSQNDKTKMQAARLMVEEKRYEVARELLKGVANRQALDWLLKLDNLIPRRRKHLNWSAALAVIFLLVCLILGLAFAIRERDNNVRIWQAQRFDAIIILSSSCAGNSDGDYTKYADRYKLCTNWAQQLIDADISRTDGVLNCIDLENAINNPAPDAAAASAQAQACIGALGIANPNFQ